LATKQEHGEKAEHNEFLISSLDNPFWDWAVTGTFYAALHYVEAYFCKTKIPSKNHPDRNNRIQGDAQIKSIYADYRELQNESRTARYDPGASFSQGDVQRLEQHLAAIKKVIVPLT
jgi:hypothetical protein